MSTKVDTLLIDPGTATTGQVLTYNATTGRWAAQTPSTPVGDDCPIGSILFFAAPTPPRGWLVCDGSNLSPVGEYADLFNVIGNIYGTVGGNFKLPDLRGEFIRGWSGSRAGVDQPRSFGGFQSDQFRSHSHGLDRVLSWPRNGETVTTEQNQGGNPEDYNTSRAATNEAGGSETRPRNIALLPCIKAVKTLPGTGDPLNFITKPATATNGQILSYNSSGNTWIASNPPTGLPTTATGGQVLTYNGSTSTWVASASPAVARSTSSFTIDGSSLAKAWVTFNGKKDTSGADSTSNTNRLINGSYRVDSVLRTGQGQYTINFSTGTFESANYAYTVGVDSKATGVRLSQAVRFGSKTLSAFQIETDDDGTDDTDDLSEVCFTFYASGGNLTGTANVFDTTPVGTVTYFAASAAPVGYMICNGTVLSRALYPELFTVIGTIYNTGGEGVSNFRLPNLLGEFIRGWDNGRGVDSGRVFGGFQQDEFKSHTHQAKGSDLLTGASNAFWWDAGNVGTATRTTLATGGSETRPRNVALLPCIKVVRTVSGDTTIINYIEKPASATNGQVLSYNSTTGRWVATDNTASLPSGSNGQVLTYNGLTETWVASAAPASSNITAVTLAGTMVILQEQQPSGTNAGNSSSGSWTKRNLNTEVSDTGGLCQLSNGQFALLAGTYAINASAPCYRGNNHRIRLFNVTDNTTTCFGTTEYAWNGTTSNVQTKSYINHIFTIPSTKTFEIQHYINTAETNGLGVALGQGTEIYTNVEITRSVALSAGNPIIDTVPVGTVSWFTVSAAPMGYLECNGSSVSRSVYSDLFAVIGTRYNTGGEGTTNFRLPDLRGEFIRGWSNGKAGVDVGRTLGSSQPDEFKSHNHTTEEYNRLVKSDGFNTNNGGSIDNVNGFLTEPNLWFSGVISPAGGAETRPRNVALLPCIKAQRTILGTTNALNFIDRPENPREGQTLVYREATGKWEAGGAGGAGGAGAGGSGSVVAWVHFDGSRDTSGNESATDNSRRFIRGSSNVTSVTRNSTGTYTVVFTNAVVDQNYCIVATARGNIIGTTFGASRQASLVASGSFVNNRQCQIFTENPHAAANIAMIDPVYVYVAIIR